jgi:hypothetical protein
MKAFLLFLVCLTTVPALARELTDLSIEVTTASKGPEAKQEAFDKAVEDGTFRLTEELLGSERTAKVWPTVKPKVLKNSTRYVVFIKGGAPVDTATGSKVQVQMRLSSDSLEALLRELGAVGQSTVRLLPLFVVSETRGSRYVWWTDTTDEKSVNFSRDLFKKLYEQFNAKFKGKNVYVLDPNSSSFRMSVPAAYRTENLRREDQVLLAQYLKADIVVSGRVEIARGENGGSRSIYDFQMWQAKSGRGLSEAQRSEVIPSDAPKVITQSVEDVSGKVAAELAGKLHEVIANGQLNLNVMRLVVEGNLGPRQATDFRRLLGGLRDIKLIRERLFEPARVTYEIETGATSNDLSKAIAKSQFPQFKVEVGSVQDNSLTLSVKAL